MRKLLLIILTLIIPHLSFSQATTYDFGDAPESYGSASHYIVLNTRYLGSQPDGEAAQQYSQEADADDLNGSDDEDGVTFPDMIQGSRVTVPIKITGSGYLNVWIDWNGDGDFADLDERVATNISRSSGNYNLSVNIPANAIASKPVFARFRYGPRTTSTPTYSSTGPASYGEVEDYMIKIICAQVGQPKVGEITQPSCEVPSGSVVLEGSAFHRHMDTDPHAGGSDHNRNRNDHNYHRT